MRVLIVDDHTLVRAGLSRLLQGFANVEVVADASNAEQALQMAIQHSPDVILMDLSLPGRTGLEALSDILLRAPGTRVVMMTMHDDAVHVRDALEMALERHLFRLHRRQIAQARLAERRP